MKPNTLTLIAALGMTATLTLGCTEEAKNAVNSTVDTTTDAVNSAKDTGGDLLDHAGHVRHDLKDKAAGALDGAKEKAADTLEGAKDTAAEQVEGLKDKAADAADALGGDLMEQANGMIAKVKDAVANGKFGDAQAILDKLQGIPGVDKLAGLKDQIASLQGMITKGKEAAGAASGMLGK